VKVLTAIAVAVLAMPCAANGQNPLQQGPRTSACWQIQGNGAVKCIDDALSLVRWRLDEYFRLSERDVDRIPYVAQAMRAKRDTLRAVQVHWRAYVEGNCHYFASGVANEGFVEKGCVVDAYDRRLAELLPLLCETSVETCAATEEFERRHQRH